MIFQDFIHTVKDCTAEKMGADFRVSLQQVLKNNGVCYEGLLIMRKGANLSPMIYLNPYYHRYLNGMSIHDICEDICCVYHRKFPSFATDMNFFLDYEKVRERLVPKLIHYEKNKEMLADVPYIRMLDLAMVFLYLFDTSNISTSDPGYNYASILIRNEHVEEWHVTTEYLYRDSLRNAPLLLPLEVKSMPELLKEFQEHYYNYNGRNGENDDDCSRGGNDDVDSDENVDSIDDDDSDENVDSIDDDDSDNGNVDGDGESNIDGSNNIGNESNSVAADNSGIGANNNNGGYNCHNGEEYDDYEDDDYDDEDTDYEDDDDYDDGDYDDDEEYAPIMYVVTNTFRINGAVSILYKGLLGKIADCLESDLVVLPSSIHEMILVPIGDIPREELGGFRQMVQEVNATQVADDEVLSNNAYYYDAENDELTIL